MQLLDNKAPHSILFELFTKIGKKLLFTNALDIKSRQGRVK
jgi:hypothetical protein